MCASHTFEFFFFLTHAFFPGAFSMFPFFYKHFFKISALSLFALTFFSTKNFLSPCFSTCNRFGGPTSEPLSHMNKPPWLTPAVGDRSLGAKHISGILPVPLQPLPYLHTPPFSAFFLSTSLKSSTCSVPSSFREVSLQQKKKNPF